MKLLPVCLVFGLCLGSARAGAQDLAVPPKLSLADALRIADERNPGLAAARAMVSMAEGDVQTAKTRPNPAFNFELEGYPLFASDRPSFVNGQEIYVRVAQELETAGRRKLRSGAADAARASAQASFEDERRRLRLEVRRAYFQIVLAKADQEAARLSLDEIDKVIAVNRMRLEQGEISGGEMRRIQVERLRFMDDVFSAELAVRNARSALLALLNAPRLDTPFDATEVLMPPADTPLSPATTAGPTLPEETPQAPAAVAALTEQAMTARADLAAARGEQARADTETRLQRALSTPNVTIDGGYRRNFGQNGLLFGVTVPLPLFNRNAGAIARADAERQFAASRVAATQAAVALDVQQAVNAVEVNRSRVGYIEREYLKNAREARDIVLTSYNAGAMDLIDFLDAQRAYRETQRTYNRALFDYRLSLFQLDAAIGRE